MEVSQLLKQKYISSLSVTRICQIIYDPAKILKPRYYSSGFGRGYRIHELLGFTNRVSVSKIIHGYKISGVPDYIDETTVGDCKTYENNESYGYQLGLAKLQTNFYGYLGDKKQRIIIMVNTNNHDSEQLSYRTNMAKAQRDILYAIEKWNQLRKVLKLV